MPQLATESFVSQYFWLLVTLCLFHYIISNEVIPHISLTIKARKYQASNIEETSINESVTSRDTIFASNDFTSLSSAAGTELEVPLNISSVDKGLDKAIKTAFKGI